MTMNTFEQDYIIDSLGAEDWQHVLTEFSDFSIAEIWLKLEGMFPAEDNNTKLAKMIYTEMHK